MSSDLEYLGAKQGGMAIGTLFLGIFIGAVAGGLATLLLTPRSGQETRELFKNKATETQHMLKDRYQDVKEKVSHVRENMKSKAEEEVQEVDAAYRQSPQ